MKQNDAFSRCHPLVNFLYFARVLLGAMLLQHPVCQVISLFCAIACFCCLGGEKPGGFRLWYALALFLVTTAVNPMFSHEGRTILRYLPSGNPLTLESILYGIGAGLTLSCALVWFSCYTRVIHYSSANIKEKSFLECLQQPLFKLYRKGQPFNGNHPQENGRDARRKALQ